MSGMGQMVLPFRSYVCEPLRHGNLFLAGDAGHTVPPTGAKGLNLALADVERLFRALDSFFVTGSDTLLDAYSGAALQRVWKAQNFSSSEAGSLIRVALRAHTRHFLRSTCGGPGSTLI